GAFQVRHRLLLGPGGRLGPLLRLLDRGASDLQPGLRLRKGRDGLLIACDRLALPLGRVLQGIRRAGGLVLEVLGGGTRHPWQGHERDDRGERDRQSTTATHSAPPHTDARHAGYRGCHPFALLLIGFSVRRYCPYGGSHW